MRTRTLPLLLAGLLAACDLDRPNPNAPTEVEIFTTREGILALSVGLQARYATSLGDFIYPAGLLTDELGATAAALSSYRDAELGDLQPNAAPVVDPWTSHYRTIKTANDLLANARNVTLSDSTLSGVLSLAYLLKAASLGQLLLGYEQIAINTFGVLNPEFVDRATALTHVLALLDSALAQVDRVPPGSEFNGSVLARGFDLRNTILAMQARYHRLNCSDRSTAGCEAALAAANAVDKDVLSVMPFSVQAPNPLFTLSVYVRPADAFRLAAEPMDQRDEFHVTVAEPPGFHQPLDNYARYSEAAAPIPLYYPDEMRLIAAEALARLGRLGEAQAQLNLVRTDCDDRAGEPDACLPPILLPLSEAELIAEIYEQRRFELFATGLRWEDARRLGSVGGDLIAERCWLLYPVTDVAANPNVPAQPEREEPPSAQVSCF